VNWSERFLSWKYFNKCGLLEPNIPLFQCPYTGVSYREFNDEGHVMNSPVASAIVA